MFLSICYFKIIVYSQTEDHEKCKSENSVDDTQVSVGSDTTLIIENVTFDSLECCLMNIVKVITSETESHVIETLTETL